MNGDNDSLMIIKENANDDNEIAQYCLASMYEQGSGVKKDIDTALKWYKKSYENGSQKGKDGYENLVIKYFLYANDVKKLNELGDYINSKCDDFSCIFSNIWTYIDISQDDKISLAEISKFQRGLVKLAAAEQKESEFEIEQFAALNLASIIFLPITASSILHSFDYDNDGLLSRFEVVGDREFASLIGIDLKDMKNKLDFKEMGRDIGGLLKKIPF